MVAVDALVGCGSSSPAVSGAANGSSSGAGGASHGASSSGAGGSEADGGDAAAAFPAFPVDMPQILKNQGAVLEAPVVVTVTWPAADSNASTWEAFDDALGASSYWSATTSEYGVGAATSGDANHVRMVTPLPASIGYTDLQTYVMNAVQAASADAGVGDAGADPTWPAPVLDAKGNAQTIYSLFIPQSTAVTDPGSMQSFCVEGALGYHDSVTVNGVSVAYAVNLSCAPLSLANVEETAAHETIEAATNPYVESSSLGFVGFDANHLAWDLYTGFNDELADACQNWETSYVEDTGTFPYWIQRSWSNAAALAGHDPCVPAAAGPYHGVTLFPSELTSVSLSLATIGGGNAKSLGFKVTTGTPITFHVGFYSDGATAPWTIAYDFPSTLADFDQNFMPLGNGKGTVTIDKTTGQNGDTATVTVTSTAKGEGGFQVMAITWDPPTGSGYLPRYQPVLLVNE